MAFELGAMKSEYPFKSNWLALQGGRLHYLDEGQGDPVLMVHGNPTWSFYWRHLVRALSTTHRCIVPDHMGCGLSDKPGDDAYSYRLNDRIDDLEELMNACGVSGRVTLIVHDWGGAIGFGWAARHPHLVRRIVILNTGAFPLPTTKKFPLPLWIVRNTWVGSLLVRGLNSFALAASWTCTVNRLPRSIRHAYRSPYDSWANRIATLRFVQDIPLGPDDPSWDTLQQVATGLDAFNDHPILVCWGLRDWVFDHHFLDEWRRRFPHADVHAWDDAGHYVLEDRRDDVIRLVQSFLTTGTS